jgi:hypothetical protein
MAVVVDIRVISNPIVRTVSPWPVPATTLR